MKIKRTEQLLHKVVFVGGLGGCGKTMLTPIVGSFNRVEIQKYNYMIEHLCTLHRLGKIGEDVAVAMIRMQTDLDIYNMMMSRETNFRFKDLSSIFKNPRPLRYLQRLFLPGDERVITRLEKEKPILHITLHDLLQHSPTLLKALGPKALFIELVRHPLYMVKQWAVNMEQFYSHQFNPREFSIGFEYKGYHLPWFTYGWEEKYLGIENKMDRMIVMIQHHIEESWRCYESMTEVEKRQLLFIPFERFVLRPEGYIENMETLLETKRTRSTLREMKRQNVPREMIAQGIGLPVYKKYGWKPPESKTETEELKFRRDFAAQGASDRGMEILDQLSRDYEKRYLQ